MPSLVARFGTWLRSVEFAVTATAVVVALGAGMLAFEASAASADGYFVLVLAGVGVPSIYENQWPTDYNRRLVGVAWALVACVVLLGCYAVVAVGLSRVIEGLAPRAAAFAASWLVGIVAARAPALESA